MAEEKTKIALPEGRLINESLFVKDQFNKEATPRYNVEVAIDDKDGIEALKDTLFAYAIETWGDAVEDDFNDGNIILPLKDGDKMAKKREDKGKEGDAYKGCVVIRAHTHFNRNGDDDAGGAEVYDEQVELVEPVNKSVIYPGCYGIVGVTLGHYDDTDPKTDEPIHAIMFYLAAFQKTLDGERLVTASDSSSLFKPVGKAAGGRKTRTRKAKEE